MQFHCWKQEKGKQKNEFSEVIQVSATFCVSSTLHGGRVFSLHPPLLDTISFSLICSYATMKGQVAAFFLNLS